MYARVLLICIVAAAASNAVNGQQPEAIKLRLTPEAAHEASSLRLLPADPELKDGNAAVVMLRMIWEQQPFMQTVMPTIQELTTLPYDDPRIIDEFQFGRFQSEMKRAAYMRDADWNYPLNEEPMAMILLPDLQGFREFVGRGMSLWVGQQIAKHDLHQAREGILIQLACSRHIARTPLTVNQLVAAAMSGIALEKVELLIQQPESPNLYWALARLPESLGDNDATMQWNAKLIMGSIPSLSQHIPPMSDDAWKQVAAEFSELMEMQLPTPLGPLEAVALRTRLLEIAKEELAEKQQFTDEHFAKMSGEEIVMRWILATTERVNLRIENAFSLTPPRALAELLKLEHSIADLMERAQAPTAPPFLEKPTIVYFALHRFDRRVKLLQTVESIRHHAAQHDGRLPASLNDLELPAPNDPMTNSPFEYSVQDGKATLRMANLDGIDPQTQQPAVYEISIAGAN